jgi:hypothetical protein
MCLALVGFAIFPDSAENIPQNVILLSTKCDNTNREFTVATLLYQRQRSLPAAKA